jgi:hypothetical protein
MKAKMVVVKWTLWIVTRREVGSYRLYMRRSEIDGERSLRKDLKAREKRNFMDGGFFSK